MTFREKLADWLCCGGLTRAREWSEHEAEGRRREEKRAAEWRDLAERQVLRINGLRKRMREIAAEEKPTSNATVKRMARMAREAAHDL